ncbi:MAG TPA: hypothetical protein DCS97_07015 [Planctomycetes bacterium]|nr:hypothetical protein [Planctomycetota bacterium]
MPASIFELFDGRSEAITGKMSADIPYCVISATDEADVRATALANIPTTYNGIPRSGISISERLNQTTWKVIARYEQASSSGGSDTATLENTYTFETGGGTQNVKSGWSIPSRYYDGGSDVPSSSAINCDGETVAGVDITIQQFQWSDTYWFAPSVITEEWKQTIAYMTGKVNSTTFRGYPSGEVLFLGASGSKQGNGYWQITFKYAHQPNRTSFTIGGITVASKEGWDYMWIRYEDDVSGSGAQKAAVKKAKFVYIEKVYEYTNLSIPGT